MTRKRLLIALALLLGAAFLALFAAQTLPAPTPLATPKLITLTAAASPTLPGGLRIMTATPTPPAPFAFEIPTLEEPAPSQDACGFQWASQPLPELSAAVQSLLQKASLPVEAASAEAYGENCLYANGEVAYFAAMQTDYHLTLQVQSLQDEQTLGDLLYTAIQVLRQIPPQVTPGENPGLISVTLQAGQETQHFQFKEDFAARLQEEGQSGAAFYQALQNPPP
jgi:hypothetical protein